MAKKGITWSLTGIERIAITYYINSTEQEPVEIYDGDYIEVYCKKDAITFSGVSIRSSTHSFPIKCNASGSAFTVATAATSFSDNKLTVSSDTNDTVYLFAVPNYPTYTFKNASASYSIDLAFNISTFNSLTDIYLPALDEYNFSCKKGTLTFDTKNCCINGDSNQASHIYWHRSWSGDGTTGKEYQLSSADGNNISLYTYDAEYTFRTEGYTPTYSVTIEYDANGGTGAPDSHSESDTSDTISITISSEKPIRNNYNFLYWICEGEIYYPGKTYDFPISDDYEVTYTLIAVWTQETLYKVTISFDANDGDEDSVPDSFSEIAYTTDISVTIPDEEPTRTGYTFNYWTRNNNIYRAGRTYTFQGSEGGEEYTLDAVWVPNVYVVTLNKQGGSGGTDSVEATYGEPLDTIEVPTKSGYIFNGYYKYKEGSGTQYYVADGTSAISSWSETDDRELYACWLAKFAWTYEKVQYGECNIKAFEWNSLTSFINAHINKDFKFTYVNPDDYFTFEICNEIFEAINDETRVVQYQPVTAQLLNDIVTKVNTLVS